MSSLQTFHLKGHIDLRVEHEQDSDILRVWFRGGYMGQYDGDFQNYVSHLESLCEKSKDPAVDTVECHMEEFGEALSRTQHAVYRMIHGMRPNVSRIAVYATDSKPEYSEHLRMAELFVQGMAGQEGATLELVKV